jgi:hypothetical protein
MVHDLGRELARRLRGRRSDESGAVMVMTLIFMVMMLAFAALIIDLGSAREQRRQMKAAADAAAIAGVEEIATVGGTFTGTATQWLGVVNQVKDYARENFGVASGEWSGCTDPNALAYKPDPGNACISADYSSWPTPGAETSTVNRLRVRIPQQDVQTAFAAVIDRNGLEINAVSVAAVTRTKTTTQTSHTEHVAGAECALCVLNDGLSLYGQNGDVTVTGGDTIVNSNPSSGNAVQLMNNGSLKELNGGVMGGPGAPGKWSGTHFTPSPTLLDPVDDPLAAVPACGTGSTCPTNVVSNANASTLNPGIYTSIKNSHTLNPGIYVIKSDITLNGNDLLKGSGVMLYFACSNYPNPCSALPVGSRNGASIKATGNGALQLTGPTSGTYKGLTIFADRQNTATSTFRGNGTNENGGHTGTSGTVYLRNGTLDLRGNGYTLSSLVVVGYLSMNGSPSGVTINYNQPVNYSVTHDETTYTSTDAFSYDASGLVG